jgi:hypothetical protein
MTPPRENKPPAGYDERAVQLPNGCWLEPGKRVRVPARLISHPEVLRNAQVLRWELEGWARSPGSEVIYWPKGSA